MSLRNIMKAASRSGGAWFADGEEDESEGEGEAEGEGEQESGELFRAWGPAPGAGEPAARTQSPPPSPTAETAAEARMRARQELLALLRAPGGVQELAGVLAEHAELHRAVRAALPASPPAAAAEPEAPEAPAPPTTLAAVSALPVNAACADCNAPEPSWASTNLGVLICTACAGVHRSLGVQTSFVLSLKLDEWSEAQVAHLASLGGNEAVNAAYEFHVPLEFPKPRPREPREAREAFIRAKYVQRLFAARRPQPAVVQLDAVPGGGAAAGAEDEPQGGGAGAGAIEFIGTLEVELLEAKGLLAMTVGGSGANPMCEMRVGAQSVKSGVCHNTLTPAWNETHLLCWNGSDRLSLEIFSEGEHMGSTQVSLLPLLGDEPALEAWAPLSERRTSSASPTSTVRNQMRRAARGSVFLGSRPATGAVHVRVRFNEIEH